MMDVVQQACHSCGKHCKKSALKIHPFDMFQLIIGAVGQTPQSAENHLIKWKQKNDHYGTHYHLEGIVFCSVACFRSQVPQDLRSNIQLVLPTRVTPTKEKPMTTALQIARILGTGVFDIEFTKVDGSLRVCKGTLQSDLLPPREEKEDKPTKAKAANDSNVSFYEVNEKAWRSFKVANLISLTYTLPTEKATDEKVS